MADTLPWIIFAILGLIVVLGIAVVFVARKKKKHEPDYYAFYVMGIIWTLFGVVSLALNTILQLDFTFTNTPLLSMGVIFLALGIANKDKWKKNRKKIRGSRALVLVGLGVVALVLGIVLFILSS